MRFVAAIALFVACAFTQAQAQVRRVDIVPVAAPDLSSTPLRVRVYLPADYEAAHDRLDVLYIDDGQDMEAVGLQATLERLDAQKAIRRIIVVAIDMPPDRMAGYGLFDRSQEAAVAATTKYGEVGADAWRYARWLTQTLVPLIDARYRTRASPEGRAILGWSLGAVSAFGIGWQYPELFGRIGAFSPSLWLAADSRDAGTVQATRIVHALVAKGAPARKPALFFAVGGSEESNDRDGDGRIDVLDDTRDLLDGWRMPNGEVSKGLHQLGYGAGGADATLFLLEGGRHDQASWGRMLPVFLRWAYAGKAVADGH